MACYKLNKEKKIITLNGEAPTAAEQTAINAYVANGYEIRVKSEARSKNAAKRAKEDKLTDAAIKAALKDDKKHLAEYEKIKKKSGKGGGFFAAKAWYKKEVLGE